MSPRKSEEDKDLIGPDELLSPSSQLGRLQQSGGTPESRRQVDPNHADDSEEWIDPKAEDATIRPSPDRST